MKNIIKSGLMHGTDGDKIYKKINFLYKIKVK